MENRVNDNRTMNAVRNAAAGIFNRAAGVLVPFVLRTALIKVLGEEYLGLSSLFTSILQVLNLADLGFGSAIFYCMYKPIAEGNDAEVCALLRLYRNIYVGIGFVILAGGLCLLPFLEKLISGGYPDGVNIYIPYMMYLINTVVGYLFFAHRQSLMAAFQRSDIESNINTVVQIILAIVKLLVLFAAKNYYLYIVFLPITTIVSGVITVSVSYRLFPQYKGRGKVNAEQKKDILKRVFGLTIQKFGNTISTSLDSIIISSFLGLSVLAIYSNYFYIVTSMMAFLWVCIGAITAGLGNSIVTNSRGKNWHLFKQVNFLNQWAISWIAPSLICLYQHFMRIWVGEELMFDYNIVLWLTFYFYIAQSRKTVLVFRDAAGIWWEDRWKPLVGCLCNLVLNILLVQMIGVGGVIISTVVSYLFIEMPWETHVLFKSYFRFSQRIYLGMQLKFLFSILLNIFVCIGICYFLPDAGLGWFLIKGIVCVAVSNGLFFACFHNLEEEKYLISNISDLLHKLKK